MTKVQVAKAMKVAGIEGELTGRGSDWKVELADEKTKRTFLKVIKNVGGYRTGYGAWVLCPGYRCSGDFNHKSSQWHY